MLSTPTIGPSAVDNASSTAEKALKIEYKGETKKFNLDKYVQVQMDQRQILSDLMQHGYSGINERSKVRHLMAGIKKTSFDAVKTLIFSSAPLCSDFTAGVGLYKDFITQSQSIEQAQLVIAAMDSERETKKKGGEVVEEDKGEVVVVEDQEGVVMLRLQLPSHVMTGSIAGMNIGPCYLATVCISDFRGMQEKKEDL